MGSELNSLDFSISPQNTPYPAPTAPPDIVRRFFPPVSPQASRRRSQTTADINFLGTETSPYTEGAGPEFDSDVPPSSRSGRFRRRSF